MAERRKTILVKRLSAFLASTWLLVRPITFLNVETEAIFIDKSVNNGIIISIRNKKSTYSLK